MTAPDAIDFNLYLVRCFDAAACSEIIAGLAQAPDDRAPVYGGRSEAGSVDERMRKVARLLPSNETVDCVMQRLLEIREGVSAHFGISLTTCEDPQFLRYREGDFFVAHQDGNTGLLRLDTELRRISTVVFLSRESETPEQDAYCGGSLVFSDLRNRFRMRTEPGTLVAFRSETTHEVTPVTHGERYSIASWYR